MKLIQIEIVELANKKFTVETKDFSNFDVTVGEAQFAKRLKDVLKELMKRSEKEECNKIKIVKQDTNYE